jgi:FtsP/CotA-like multicopper oxidase with cupredoxin domain
LPLAFSAMFSSAAEDNVHASNAKAAVWEKIDFGSLTERRSQAGVLATTLHAAGTPVSIDGVHFDGATYDGQYGGPILHVRAGDHVLIKLANDLNEPTNLHFHGLHITPGGRGDNMHVVVLPHTTMQYDFRIPADHPPGLFWFHDHLHGMAEKHVTSGLAGIVLIDGFTEQFGGLEDVPQRLVVLKDYAEPGCTDPKLKAELHCRLLTINGQFGGLRTLVPISSSIWRFLVLRCVSSGVMACRPPMQKMQPCSMCCPRDGWMCLSQGRRLVRAPSSRSTCRPERANTS